MQLNLRFVPARSKGNRKVPSAWSAKFASAALIGMSALLVTGLCVLTLQNQRDGVRNAEAAATYVPAVAYTPPPDAPEVAFIGDSFTAGTGASEKRKRWTSLLSKEQRWDERNFGIGGSSFIRTDESKADDSYPSQVPDVVKSHPDIVIVSTAGNALHKDQKAGIDITFDLLREELPDARIIATSPYFRSSGLTSEHREKAQQIEEAVESVGGEYLELNDPLKDHPDVMAEDGAHPNDLGHKLIANAVAKALS